MHQGVCKRVVLEIHAILGTAFIFWLASLIILSTTRIFYKQLLYKQGSTRQGKKLSNFSTGLKTAKQFEKLYFQYLTGNVN